MKKRYDSKVLMILGMGRSGTSFTTSWLQACGLPIGNELPTANWMNKKGFFEDKEVLTFQNAIFKRQGKAVFEIGLADNLAVTTDDILKAKTIVESRHKMFKQWGWKDPRTNILLENLWHKLLPKANHLLVYRPYWEVVDSICRIKNYEQQEQFKRRNKIMAVVDWLKFNSKNSKEERWNRYLEAWIRHNRDAIRYISKNKTSQEFCAVSVDGLLKKPEEIFQTLSQKMSFDLTYVHPGNLYDQEMYQRARKEDFSFDPHLQHIAEDMMKRLQAIANA